MTDHSASALTDEQRIALIQSAIRQRGDELRARYPILARNNLLGMSIFLFAVAGVVGSGWAYWQGLIPAWLCIPLVAIFTSLLHELEHDLIHWQYFKKNKRVHNFMLLVGWILRPGTINPWVRRHLHFLHHKTSGTSQDMEERGIGNGANYGPLRFLVMMDTFLGNILRVTLFAPKGPRWGTVKRLLFSNFPFSWLTALVWYGFLLFHAANGLAAALETSIAWSEQTLAWMDVVNKLVVVLIAPFYLRSFSLNFISSNMHYYGGVDSLLKQTQVLNAWYFWPFQLFCFNFGSTHGIHHFVVGEPFYIRQLTASVAHRVMREQGVRFNDLGTFGRANHYEIRRVGKTATAL